MSHTKRRRSLIKTFTWRAAATIDTVLIAWIITRRLSIGLAIGSLEVFTKMILYYFHERAWDRVEYGWEESK